MSAGPERRRRNHLLWLGPLLTFGGAVSYFTTFARYPALRDFPWLNLPLVLLGPALSLVALRRSIKRRSRRAIKAAAVVGTLFSFGLASLFCGYVFFLSALLPSPTATTLSISEMPDLTLLDQRGREVSLSSYRGRKLVLTFYRGYW